MILCCTGKENEIQVDSIINLKGKKHAEIYFNLHPEKHMSSMFVPWQSPESEQVKSLPSWLNVCFCGQSENIFCIGTICSSDILYLPKVKCIITAD